MVVVQEFVVATNLTTAGSAEDKLRWAFRMYDKDGSGQLIVFVIIILDKVVKMVDVIIASRAPSQLLRGRVDLYFKVCL